MSNTITYASGNFSTLPNQLISDPKISLSAKGLYAFMSVTPDCESLTIATISSQVKEGPTAIRNYLNELRKTGWIDYKRLKQGGGRYLLLTQPKLTDDGVRL